MTSLGHNSKLTARLDWSAVLYNLLYILLQTFNPHLYSTFLLLIILSTVHFFPSCNN